jgi:predicted dehydrogenase
MDVVKLGAVGCGRQATRNIQASIPHIPEFEFIATCDLRSDLAERNARNFGARRSYTDAREMFEREELDAVIIVGPPELHASVGREAAAAGLHVFTEKPIASTPDDAAALVTAIEDAGVFGQVGHMSRHADAVRIAREIVDGDAFGPVTFVESKYHTPGPYEPTGVIPTAFRTYNLYQTTHAIDLARHFGGDVARLTAARGEGRDEAFALTLMLEFAGGAVGWVNVNSCVPAMESRLEVTGANREFVGVDNLTERRYVPADAWHGGESAYRAIAASSWRPGPLTTGHSRPGYSNQLSHFARSVLDGVQPFPSTRDGYEAVRLCFAIEDSLDRGAWVDV